MKKGYVIGSVAVLASALAMAVFPLATQSDEEYYEPRSDVRADQGIAGAIEYYHMLRRDPVTNEVPMDEVLRVREEVAAMNSQSRKKSALNLQWEMVGPTNVGGRTRAFLIDKDNSSVMFAGSVGGGLFRSTNAGASWVRVSDPLSNHAVSSIAQSSNGDIYYGTGEGLYMSYGGTAGTQTPGFIGGGIYRSTDGGNTFTVLPNTVPAGNTNNSEFAHVGKLAVDPNNPNRIYAATNRGLRVSDDAGDSWTNPVTGVGANVDCTDMFVTNSGKVWIKTGNTIRLSQDGNAPYEEITSFGGIQRNGARMRIAVAPQDENYVYVISIDGDQFGTAYQSTDGGDTWRKIGERTTFLNPHGTQGNYNNALTVDPKNKERIIVGGIQLWEWSEQGGWQQIATGSAPKTSPFYVHVDNHHVYFLENKPNTFYVVNDGGIFRTTDNGFSFVALNNNYNTKQYYHISVGPEGRVMGGSQDNGTVIINPNDALSTRGRDVLGGDGGYSVMSKLRPGLVVGESQRGNTRRSADYGNSWSDYIDFNRMDPDNVFATDAWGNWITPFTMWEKLRDDKSEDSVSYGTDTIDFSIGFGSGNTIFEREFPQPTEHIVFVDSGQGLERDSAIFIAESMIIYTNQDTVFSDSLGNLSGAGTGTFNPSNGRFRVTFNNPVVLEVRARVATRYEGNRIVEVRSAINDLPLYDTLVNSLEPGNFRTIQDPVQSAFFIGLRTRLAQPLPNGTYVSNHKGGIWMTREIASRVEATPQWIHIANLRNNEAPTCMAVGGDAEVLYVGTAQGRVYRISNISNARDSASADIDSLYVSNNFVRASTSIIDQRTIANFSGQVVTSISVHPDDPGRVMVTLGNYGRSTHVYFSPDLDAPTPSPLMPVQGNLPAMPVYASTFNFTGNQNQVLIGTEYGIYATEDITAGTVTWEKENSGFAEVPVFTLVQDLTVRYDQKDENDFEGTTYAGSHALGVYKTNSTANFVRIDQEEYEVEEEVVKESLSMYPNPASDMVNIELNLERRTNVEVNVRNLSGKQVKQVRYEDLGRDTREIELRLGSLPRGTYIVSLRTGQKVTTGKIIKK